MLITAVRAVCTCFGSLFQQKQKMTLPKQQQPNCANYGGLVCHLECFVLRSCEGGEQVSVCSGVEI